MPLLEIGIVPCIASNELLQTTGSFERVVQ